MCATLTISSKSRSRARGFFRDGKNTYVLLCAKNTPHRFQIRIYFARKNIAHLKTATHSTIWNEEKQRHHRSESKKFNELSTEKLLETSRSIPPAYLHKLNVLFFSTKQENCNLHRPKTPSHWSQKIFSAGQVYVHKPLLPTYPPALEATKCGFSKPKFPKPSKHPSPEDSKAPQYQGLTTLNTIILSKSISTITAGTSNSYHRKCHGWLIRTNWEELWTILDSSKT